MPIEAGESYIPHLKSPYSANGKPEMKIEIASSTVVLKLALSKCGTFIIQVSYDTLSMDLFPFLFLIIIEANSGFIGM